MIRVLRNMGACIIITLIFVACNTKTNSTTYKLNNQNQEHFILDTDDLSISPSLTTKPTNLITPKPVETENIIDNFIIITTPFPTVETTLDIPEDRKNLIMNSFKSDSGCLLPCWNNIIPGISKTQDLIDIMELLYGESFENHEFPDKASIYEENFSTPNNQEEDFFPVLQINWENETVTEIKIVAWDYPGYFNLSDLFRNYGIPDSIKLRLDERNLIRHRYMVVLSYIDEQFIYAIHGNIYQAQNKDNILDYVCLSDNNEQYHDLYIYNEYPLLFDKENLNDFPWSDWANGLGVSTEDLFYELIDLNTCVFYPIQFETSTSQVFSTITPAMGSPTALYSTIIPADQKREILINIKTPFPGVTNVDKTPAAFDKYMDVFNPENGCQLPCWNGIIPGISGNKELSKITEILYGVDVKTLGLDEDTMIHEESFPNPDKSGDEIYPLLEIRRESDVVTDIEIDSWDKPEYFCH